mgnify:CR=1 FL=1
MLRYGIPAYRFPREKLDAEINSILSTGIEVKKNISVGTDITLEDINKDYNAVYISIGAHADKKIGIDGELTSRTYETEKKEKRQVVEIMIQNVEFCDGKRDESGDDANITTPSKAESTTPETEDELPF